VPSCTTSKLPNRMFSEAVASKHSCSALHWLGPRDLRFRPSRHFFQSAPGAVSGASPENVIPPAPILNSESCLSACAPRGSCVREISYARPNCVGLIDRTIFSRDFPRRRRSFIVSSRPSSAPHGSRACAR
jgi:hypothetical protein